MSNTNRFPRLLESLALEIRATKAGSDQGQFPILDLLGNLRDEAAAKLEQAALHKTCSEAWEKVVRIVESGKPFFQPDIDWLNALLAEISGAQPTAAPAAAPVVAATPPVAPAAPPAAPQALEAAPAPATPAPPATEDQPIILNIAGDGDLLREFITESREHLDNIEQGVLVLENQPGDAETLNTIFRAFHTFKGGAGFLNLMPINRLAHGLESLLDLARQNKLEINAPVIEIILQGRDLLKKFVYEIEAQVAGNKPVAPIVIATTTVKATVARMLQQAAEGAPLPAHTPPANAAAETAPAKESAPDAPAAETPTRNANLGAMVKVDTGKLDSLLDLVGEMVIAQSLVSQNPENTDEARTRFTRDMAQLGRITRELQRVSMSLRMMPIRGVFQKMARVARDISIKQHKKVNFQTGGEDTELDRGVVEELGDPLLHMIRNSMDHGIESAEKREAAGKPPIGTLNLRAYHQGGNIVVEIEDDGSGLNRDKILAKAIERGLATPDEKLTDEEIYKFIFAAGFSTAEKVTDLSGRGVGLDVVRRNIERLRGSVDIVSTFGRGTLFRIKLPLTLAIIDGLIVKVGDERYVLPALSVREAFRPTPQMITHVNNLGEVVNVRGRLIPLLRLNQFFDPACPPTDVTDGIVMVVESGVNVRCLLVDQLLHKQEVVIKNLNEMMVHKNHTLAGAAILGDGRVGLILDINTLVHETHVRSVSKAA